MNSLISKSSRRLVAARLQQRGAMRRTFHATAALLGGDALDMVDTFARRHRKFQNLKV